MPKHRNRTKYTPKNVARILAMYRILGRDEPAVWVAEDDDHTIAKNVRLTYVPYSQAPEKAQRYMWEHLLREVRYHTKNK